MSHIFKTEQKLIYFERVARTGSTMEYREALATYLLDRWRVMNIVPVGDLSRATTRTEEAFVGGAAFILLEREALHEHENGP